MLAKLLLFGLAVHCTAADVIKAYSDVVYQASGAQYLRWSVEVYRYTDGDGVPEHTCSGSLVKPAVVISAARCFWGKEGLLPASQFFVTENSGGNKSEDSMSSVRSIHLPPSFRGLAGLYADDIAVLKLATTLHGVTPICVSFDHDLDTRQLVEGNFGRTMGMLEKAGSSPLFTALEFPYVTMERCANGSEPYYREQLTPDKICAEFPPSPIGRPEHRVCRGDHGSGLAFYRGSSYAAVPYLRGIASIPSPNPYGPYWTLSRCIAFRAKLESLSPDSDEAKKMAGSLQGVHEPRGVRYAAFTHIAAHRAFLERHVPGLEAACRQHYATADVSDKNTTADSDSADVGVKFECNCICNN